MLYPQTALNEIGMAYKKNGRVEDALGIFKKATKLDRDYRWWFTKPPERKERKDEQARGSPGRRTGVRDLGKKDQVFMEPGGGPNPPPPQPLSPQ